MKATRRRLILVDDNGDGVWRNVEVYRRGTPAGPDPDRAEMLLAVGLANYDTTPKRRCATKAGSLTHRLAEAISGITHGDDGSDWSASYNDAGRVTGAWPVAGAYDRQYELNPAAYAAGAALAMALESP